MKDRSALKALDAHVTALFGPQFTAARNWLISYRERTQEGGLPAELRQRIQRVKSDSIATKDQVTAKAAWCLETVAQVQEHYLTAVTRMQAGQYYSGWCGLERAEIALHALDRHLRDPKHHFGLEIARHQIRAFQGIYPYKLFISPEIWERDVRCSICDARVTPREGCGHSLGEIYDGAYCHRVVKQSELLGVSLVRVPVQKYSVVYQPDPAVAGGEPNAEAYPTVRYVLDRLGSPWNLFRFEWKQARHPHAQYRQVLPTDECPCIAPKGAYAHCCGPTEGVLRPHLAIEFETPPPPELQDTVYT